MALNCAFSAFMSRNADKKRIFLRICQHHFTQRHFTQHHFTQRHFTQRHFTQRHFTQHDSALHDSTYIIVRTVVNRVLPECFPGYGSSDCGSSGRGTPGRRCVFAVKILIDYFWRAADKVWPENCAPRGRVPRELSFLQASAHTKGSLLDLRTVPAVIAGAPENRHGIILAKSIPA